VSFDNKWVLGFLSLIVLLVPVVIARYRKSLGKAACFAAASSTEDRESVLREIRLRILASDIFFLLFIGFLIIAMAGPRWGIRITADYRRGVDIIMAFDLSRSMNVRDSPPAASGRIALNSAAQENISRLERGGIIAREFAAALPDVRLGAAIGKGKGILTVPLTYDMETIFAFLSGLDSQAITGRGTNLESLVNAAADSFQDSIPSRRGIILFSDGESLSGSFQAAVEKARKAGISICAVGLGSEEGGPVPLTEMPAVQQERAQAGGFLPGVNGEPVISSLQAALLRSGAEKTGGIYVDGARNDAARSLAEYVKSLSSESRLSGHRREANPRWRIFIIAALICLALMRILGFTRRRNRQDNSEERQKLPARNAGKSRWILSGLICVILFGSCSRTQGKLLIMEANFYNARGLHTQAIASYLKALSYEDSAPYAEYGLGSTYFALEENAAALERYKTAGISLSELKREGHGELRYRLHYNAGIIYFEQGDYEEAASAFRDALKVDGSKIEAKRNLELSLISFARNSSPEAASPRGRIESAQAGTSAASSVIFEYLKEKEQEQWKSREWTAESDHSGPDY